MFYHPPTLGRPIQARVTGGAGGGAGVQLAVPGCLRTQLGIQQHGGTQARRGERKQGGEMTRSGDGLLFPCCYRDTHSLGGGWALAHTLVPRISGSWKRCHITSCFEGKKVKGV